MEVERGSSLNIMSRSKVQQDQSKLFFWSLMRFRKNTIKLKPISQKDKPYPNMFLRVATNTKT
jgi:hypothetical protein